MAKLLDLSGRVYGRLTVLCREGNLYGKVGWKCKCECGNELIVAGADLKGRNKASCGCLKRDIARLKNFSHGMTETAEYRAWCKAKSRCTVESDPSYKNYGQRGIMMCPQWLNSFENFFADMGPKPDGNYSIERLNVNGDYEPGNCVWATQLEQSRNKRNTVRVIHEGESVSLHALADRLRVPYMRLYKRIFIHGWDVERAVST